MSSVFNKVLNRSKGLLVVGLLAGFWSAFSWAVEPLPAQTITAEVRCPVCGMYPARYPKWAAQVVLADRSLRAFDSPADLFRYLHSRARYEKQAGAAQISAIYLTDYAKGGWVAAPQAWLVVGSKVLGPMRHADLPAFGSRDGAEQFMREQGGRLFSFEGVTPELVRSFDAAAAAHAAGHDHHGAHGHHDHHGH